MQNWEEFIYTKLAKKKSPHKSSQFFANVPSSSRDFFPKYQKMLIFHRQLLLNNTNNFPWAKILGKRKHVIAFIYLLENEEIDILCKTEYNNCVKPLIRECTLSMLERGPESFTDFWKTFRSPGDHRPKYFMSQ